MKYLCLYPVFLCCCLFIINAPVVVAAEHRAPAQDVEVVRTPQAQRWQALAEVRPRLYLSSEKISFLRAPLSQYPWDVFWAAVKKQADWTVRTNPPADANGYDDDTIRRLGNRLPPVAMAYVLTGKQRYLASARQWMNALVSYPDWASNEDLGAAHLLFGMALTYDWLYSEFSEQERSRYRKKIKRQAGILYHLLVSRKKWWARAYTQNHNYTNVMALAVAGVALLGEEPQAREWIIAARSNFSRVLEHLSPDGASHEGVGYWGYGMDALLKYFAAVEPLFGIQKIQNSPYFQHAAMFRLYASLPGYHDNVDYADSPRFDWYGPGYILRKLASVFHDPLAQWLAFRIEKARKVRPRISWLDLLWYDPAVATAPPDDLPTSKLFANLGIFISRSDWSDNATWLFFKAGPSQGHMLERQGRFVASHVHPDEGEVLLWSRGKWIFVDEGYSRHKLAMDHNVLIVCGMGQLGEGKTWFDRNAVQSARGTSKIIKIIQRNDYEYISAELQRMYPLKTKLMNWERTVVNMKQYDILVVRDNVSLSGANCNDDTFFSWHLGEKVESAADTFDVAHVRIQIKTLPVEQMVFVGYDRKKRPMLNIPLYTEKKKMGEIQHAVVYTVVSKRNSPYSCKIQQAGYDTFVFQCNTGKIQIDFRKHQVAY